MKTENIEKLIVSGLLKYKDFSNVALTFTKTEYFENIPTKKLVDIILEYSYLYNKLPVKESIEIELDKDKTLSQDDYRETIEMLSDVYSIQHDESNLEYMLDECEKYYRVRSAYNAVMDCINILDGKDKKRDEESLPEIMQDAIGVCFDMQVGHDYFEDVQKRRNQEEEEKIPFKLDMLNTITNGGPTRKTLIVPMAVPGGGKSMIMSDWAAYLIKKGYNCIYFTMELSEERVAERVDSTMFDIPVKSLLDVDDDIFQTQVNKIKNVSKGRLVIKEFPSGAASVADFRRIINELNLKKNFKPDVIFVDYIGICASARMKTMDGNSYGIGKAVVEELRGLAQETNTVMVAPAQINRGGYKSSADNIGMDNVADSIGIAHTADMMFSLYTNDELKDVGKVIITQLKNRFGDPDKFKRFAVGQDSSRMKFYDLSEDDEENQHLFDKYKQEETMLSNIVSNVNTIDSVGFDFD